MIERTLVGNKYSIEVICDESGLVASAKANHPKSRIKGEDIYFACLDQSQLVDLALRHLTNEDVDNIVKKMAGMTYNDDPISNIVAGRSGERAPVVLKFNPGFADNTRIIGVA
ncbi:hypothetical protein HYV88_02830 [Candidatus Woesearchaeota archaeon]|nr:hypothetical protein [Candidatus Woesearchaeota archaeon]